MLQLLINAFILGTLFFADSTN